MISDEFITELRIRCAAETLRSLVCEAGQDYSGALYGVQCGLGLSARELMGTVELYDQLRRPVLRVVPSGSSMSFDEFEPKSCWNCGSACVPCQCDCEHEASRDGTHCVYCAKEIAEQDACGAEAGIEDER